MNFIHKYKKIGCFILSVFLIMPLCFFSQPKTIAAVYPVIDMPHISQTKIGNVILGGIALTNTVTAEATEIMSLKEYILDTLAWMAKDLLLQEITTSIVNWINSGFEGNPAFITDFDGFMENIADITIGKFIEGSDLKFLCSPFKLDIQVALNFAFRKEYKATCTLSDAIENAGGAIADLENDWKWGTWATMTTSDNNNAYSAYLKAHENLTTLLNEDKKKESAKISWGGGFMSYENCETYLEDVCDADGTNCTMEDVEKCTIQTPGSVLSDGLNKTLGLGPDTLVVADEIDEIVGALLSQLMKEVIGPGGLLGQSPTHDNPSEPTCAMSAEPLTITSGESSILSWTSTEATSSYVDQGIGPVSANGSAPVSPAANTTYTGSFFNAAGTASCSVEIIVVPPTPPTCSMSVSPDVVAAGTNTILSWTSSGADSAYIDPDLGYVGVNDSASITPTATTTVYTGTFLNAGGQTNCQATVTVTESE